MCEWMGHRKTVKANCELCVCGGDNNRWAVVWGWLQASNLLMNLFITHHTHTHTHTRHSLTHTQRLETLFRTKYITLAEGQSEIKQQKEVARGGGRDWKISPRGGDHTQEGDLIWTVWRRGADEEIHCDLGIKRIVMRWKQGREDLLSEELREDGEIK